MQKYATKYQHGIILKWTSGKQVSIAHPLTAARLLMETYEEE